MYQKLGAHFECLVGKLTTVFGVARGGGGGMHNEDKESIPPPTPKSCYGRIISTIRVKI